MHQDIDAAIYRCFETMSIVRMSKSKLSTLVRLSDNCFDHPWRHFNKVLDCGCSICLDPIHAFLNLLSCSFCSFFESANLDNDIRRSEEHTSELQSVRHLVCRHL